MATMFCEKCLWITSFPFNPWEWPASNFSLQLYCWIKHLGHKNNGNYQIIIFFLPFFFSVRLQTNFGCNENICKVWKSNRHWGKNKTSFQSYLTGPPLFFSVSWQVWDCFHRMLSQGLFFQVYWSLLKASIQR